MNNTLRILLALSLLPCLLAACSFKPDSEAQIREAVEATVAAIPAYTPYPLPTPYPSPTPLSLSGLFCEYRFCIGHPDDMAFFDVNAQSNPTAPSGYTQGILAAYNANLFIQLIWQRSEDSADPTFLLDLILEEDLDLVTGDMEVMLIRDLNVVYAPISSSASNILPYGSVAAWTCGNRVFAWKVYSPQQDLTREFFDEAIQRFRCEE